MRKYILILFILGHLIPAKAQSANDHALVLQKCIDLEALQSYYPVDVQGRQKPIFVMQHGISFQENINVSKNGHPLTFLTKQEIKDNGVNAYFLFQEFTIAQNTAQVDFVYHYNRTTTDTNLLHITADLEKKDGLWVIVQSQIEKR